MFLIFALLITLSSARLNFNSEACSHYIYKFKSSSKNEYNSQLLAFTGDASIALNQNVVVNLRYSDPLFDDALYWGLTQEDGKSANDTCLDLKLFKFTSKFSNPIQITDLPFLTASNVDNKWRYLSLSFNKNEFSKYLIQSNNSCDSNNYIYYGYYAIAYYPAETNQMIQTFYFQFSVTISKFEPYFQGSECPLGTICQIEPSSQLQWCTDITCSNCTIPSLYLNDKFSSNLSNYFLTNAAVCYVGDGLNKQTIPVIIDNSKTGQVLLQLTADILWSNLSIQVTSYLSTTQNGTRLLGEVTNTANYDPFTGEMRILQLDTIYDPVSGWTESIECVKMSANSTSCPTCDEECQVNGFSAEGCPSCEDPKASIYCYILNILILTYLII